MNEREHDNNILIFIFAMVPPPEWYISRKLDKGLFEKQLVLSVANNVKEIIRHQNLMRTSMKLSIPFDILMQET